MPKMRYDKLLEVWWVDCVKCTSSMCGKPGAGLTEQQTAEAAISKFGYRDTEDGWVCSTHK